MSNRPEPWTPLSKFLNFSPENTVVMVEEQLMLQPHSHSGLLLRLSTERHLCVAWDWRNAFDATICGNTQIGFSQTVESHWVLLVELHQHSGTKNFKTKDKLFGEENVLRELCYEKQLPNKSTGVKPSPVEAPKNYWNISVEFQSFLM